MKTLKFRIYDKTEKRMKFLDGVWNMPDPSYDFDDIQQFTGLLDRFGVEIYEGDVIDFENGYVSAIRFEDGCFLLDDCIFRNDLSHGIIIGNIYENPELLDK
jgi:hypothetical protein